MRVRAIALLVAGTGAQAAPTLTCRTQVSFSCRPVCIADTGPADLEFDFASRSGMFCRGEQCDQGALTFSDATGQWDERPYRLFRMHRPGRGGFTVSGVIRDGTVFAATSDELGQLAGTCGP